MLGQSLIFICQHSDASVVEKIRRTVKIWGDQRVFTLRYVNELLKGLEPYRNNRGNTAPTPPQTQQQQQQQQPLSHEGGTFSPAHSSSSPEQEPATTTPSPHPTQQTATNATAATAQSGNSSNNKTNNNKDNDDGEDSDDPMDIFNDDDEDDDNVFGASEGGAKLDVEINFDSSALNSPTPPATTTQRPGTKRRRSSNASAGSQSSHKKKRRTVLSTTSLSELWKQVSSLQQSFDHTTTMLKGITLPTPEELDNLVGDELLQQYQKINQYQERVEQERRNLHSIATERRALEQEAVRYLPWLEAALKQDADDIQFCQRLEQSLQKFMLVHPAIREARDKRVEEELRYRREQEEKERKRKQEEENKRFREAALSKETEAKPGMVWNKVTQEYQYLNTDESWRD